MNHTSLTINEAFSAAKAAQSTFADRICHRMKESGIRFITVYPPNFDNFSPLNDHEWSKSRTYPEATCLTARNVFESVKFALLQDRICSIDKIVLSNNLPS